MFLQVVFAKLRKYSDAIATPTSAVSSGTLVDHLKSRAGCFEVGSISDMKNGEVSPDKHSLYLAHRLESQLKGFQLLEWILKT